MKIRMTLISLLLASMFLVVSGAVAAPIPAGDDGFAVPAGPSNNNNFFTFFVTPIPADFFWPGSDPFDGDVFFEGATGGIDTVVRRLDPTIDLDPPIKMDTIDIELVALHLTSIDPITVIIPGPTLTQWDVEVELSVVPAPLGQMEITKTHPNGGTFSADFSVQPRFTFTGLAAPFDVRVLDTGLEATPPLLFQLIDPNPAPWNDDIPNSDDFVPGFDGIDLYPLVFQTVGGIDQLTLITPEPSCFLMAVIGLGMVSCLRRRKK